MKIKFLTTGGTIDKVYFDAKSEYEVGPPQVLEVLQDGNVTCEFEVESILAKDSLEMTDADRQFIRQKIEADPNPRIVITHGTLVPTALRVEASFDQQVAQLALLSAVSALDDNCLAGLVTDDHPARQPL